MADYNIRNLEITQNESWYEQLYLYIKNARYPKITYCSSLSGMLEQADKVRNEYLDKALEELLGALPSDFKDEF